MDGTLGEHQKNVQTNVRRVFELLQQQAASESVVGRFATGNVGPPIGPPIQLHQPPYPALA